MERFGAVGDDLQAMVRSACGDLDRDRGEPQQEEVDDNGPTVANRSESVIAYKNDT